MPDEWLVIDWLDFEQYVIISSNFFYVSLKGFFELAYSIVEAYQPAMTDRPVPRFSQSLLATLVTRVNWMSEKFRSEHPSPLRH